MKNTHNKKRVQGTKLVRGYTNVKSLDKVNDFLLLKIGNSICKWGLNMEEKLKEIF